MISLSLSSDFKTSRLFYIACDGNLHQMSWKNPVNIIHNAKGTFAYVVQGFRTDNSATSSTGPTTLLRNASLPVDHSTPFYPGRGKFTYVWFTVNKCKGLDNVGYCAVYQSKPQAETECIYGYNSGQKKTLSADDIECCIIFALRFLSKLFATRFLYPIF